MSIYKKASQLGLRFKTTKGLLTVEQLWQLSLTDLSNSVKSAKKLLKETDDDELSFLDEVSKVDESVQLTFDILKDVYITKKQELKDIRDRAEKKAQREKILHLIAEKRDDSLRNLSVEELEKLLD